MKYNKYIFIIIGIITIYCLFIIINNSIYDNFNNFDDFNDFDAYVINLPTSTDRLANFMKQYNASDLSSFDMNVYPAILGKTLDIEKYVTPKAYQQILISEKTGLRKHHYELTRGAIGCYLSHLDIYKKIVNSNKDYGLIFEDDIEIPNNIYKLMNIGLNKINKIDPNWDMYLLGYICIDCDIKKSYIIPRRFWCTHSYVITKRGAEKLLKYLDPSNGNLLSRQIDSAMALLIKDNKLKVYGVNPPICNQSTLFYSSIQTGVINSNSPDAFIND
jgi:glycosyl transferase family 25